ncbi:MAG TPA: enoyl-CoA hydratase/isomerase family protein [Longimicrobiales bacterium]|nr:enoyl-CoA hydratase/isomerase family protein [Longimicrobiales bacterium]
MTRAAGGAAPRLAIEGPVARIVLDRPEQHNALRAADVSALLAHLDAADADADVRVLVLTGRGGTFCAGASLDELASGALTPGRFAELTDRLAAARVPVVCGLNGAAYGGGVELALCCDLRVAVQGARAAVPAARLGICYPLGGVRRLVGALGPAVAARLLLADEALEGDELVRTGFVHRIVPPGALDAALDELAGRLAALAPLALQGMKRLLGEARAVRPDEALARRLVERCERSEDLAEGLAARRERRDPVFRGR